MLPKLNIGGNHARASLCDKLGEDVVVPLPKLNLLKKRHGEFSPIGGCPQVSHVLRQPHRDVQIPQPLAGPARGSASTPPSLQRPACVLDAECQRAARDRVREVRRLERQKAREEEERKKQLEERDRELHQARSACDVDAQRREIARRAAQRHRREREEEEVHRQEQQKQEERRRANAEKFRRPSSNMLLPLVPSRIASVPNHMAGTNTACATPSPDAPTAIAPGQENRQRSRKRSSQPKATSSRIRETKFALVCDCGSKFIPETAAVFCWKCGQKRPLNVEIADLVTSTASTSTNSVVDIHSKHSKSEARTPQQHERAAATVQDSSAGRVTELQDRYEIDASDDQIVADVSQNVGGKHNPPTYADEHVFAKQRLQHHKAPYEKRAEFVVHSQKPSLKNRTPRDTEHAKDSDTAEGVMEPQETSNESDVARDFLQDQTLCDDRVIGNAFQQDQEPSDGNPLAVTALQCRESDEKAEKSSRRQKLRKDDEILQQDSELSSNNAADEAHQDQEYLDGRIDIAAGPQDQKPCDDSVATGTAPKNRDFCEERVAPEIAQEYQELAAEEGAQVQEFTNQKLRKDDEMPQQDPEPSSNNAAELARQDQEYMDGKIDIAASSQDQRPCDDSVATGTGPKNRYLCVESSAPEIAQQYQELAAEEGAHVQEFANQKLRKDDEILQQDPEPFSNNVDNAAAETRQDQEYLGDRIVVAAGSQDLKACNDSVATGTAPKNRDLCEERAVPEIAQQYQEPAAEGAQIQAFANQQFLPQDPEPSTNNAYNVAAETRQNQEEYLGDRVDIAARPQDQTPCNDIVATGSPTKSQGLCEERSAPEIAQQYQEPSSWDAAAEEDAQVQEFADDSCAAAGLQDRKTCDANVVAGLATQIQDVCEDHLTTEAPL